MSSRDLTLLGYLLIASAGALLQILAWTGRTRVPTLGELLSSAMRSRPGRVGILTGWAWLGMHFFAR
jgi:hypothetical protein